MRPSIRVLLSALALLVPALALAACGDDEGTDADKSAPADAVVPSNEQNQVELGGIEYRVTIFRQLNTRIAPDSAYYRGGPPASGSGYYAAFIHACNTTEQPQPTAETMRLLNGFGETFERLEPSPENELAYHPVILDPGDCTPSGASVAETAADGAVVAFEVPFDETEERPMLLEIPPAEGDDAEEPVRIELDL